MDFSFPDIKDEMLLQYFHLFWVFLFSTKMEFCSLSNYYWPSPARISWGTGEHSSVQWGFMVVMNRCKQFCLKSMFAAVLSSSKLFPAWIGGWWISSVLDEHCAVAMGVRASLKKSEYGPHLDHWQQSRNVLAEYQQLQERQMMSFLLASGCHTPKPFLNLCQSANAVSSEAHFPPWIASL